MLLSNAFLRNDFHASPSDQLNMPELSHKDNDRNHLSKKHIAERSEDQAQVSLITSEYLFTS